MHSIEKHKYGFTCHDAVCGSSEIIRKKAPQVAVPLENCLSHRDTVTTRGSISFSHLVQLRGPAKVASIWRAHTRSLNPSGQKGSGNLDLLQFINFQKQVEFKPPDDPDDNACSLLNVSFVDFRKLA